MLKVKWSGYRPGVAQRMGRGIVLLFHDHGTRRGWVVSRTPRPHFTPRKDPIPIVQEAGWAPGPVWLGGKSRPHSDSIPEPPARSQSLYWLSYPALHTYTLYLCVPCDCHNKQQSFPCTPLIHWGLGSCVVRGGSNVWSSPVRCSPLESL